MATIKPLDFAFNVLNGTAHRADSMVAIIDDLAIGTEKGIANLAQDMKEVAGGLRLGDRTLFEGYGNRLVHKERSADKLATQLESGAATLTTPEQALRLRGLITSAADMAREGMHWIHPLRAQ